MDAYRAVVDGYVTEATLAELEKGIWLGDSAGKGFKSAMSHVKIGHRTREKTVLEVTIRESRNPQVRRMLASLGHKVRELTRIKMGPLTLERLGPGESRELSPKEVRLLREATEKKARPKDATKKAKVEKAVTEEE